MNYYKRKQQQQQQHHHHHQQEQEQEQEQDEEQQQTQQLLNQKRKIYLNTNEQYEYEDIVLRDINVFKPNMKLMENIRRMEENIQVKQGINHSTQQQQQKLKKKMTNERLQPGHLRDIIHIKGHPRKGLKISTCSRCEANIPVSCCYNTKKQPHPIRGIHCQVLGPHLCNDCYTDRKAQEKEEALKRVIERFDIREYPTDKEKAIFKILSGHEFMNYKGTQDRCLARSNTPLDIFSQQNKPRYHSSDQRQSLKHSLKLATSIWKEIESKNEEERNAIEETRRNAIEEKEEKNFEENEEITITVDNSLENQLKQKVVPPNSMSTPNNERKYHLPPAPCRSVQRSPVNPYNDLEWFYEIPQTPRKYKNDIAEKQNGRIDVILLATKLSEIFKQRYLPPERTLSRISSVSSVDLLDCDMEKYDFTEYSERQTPPAATGKHVTLSSKTPEEIRVLSSTRLPLHATIIEEERTSYSTSNSNKDNNSFISSVPTEPPIVNMESVRGYFTPHNIENF